MKKVALLIWSEIIASLALSNTDATASSPILDTGDKSNKTQIAIKEESKPDLFLRQAAEDYAGQMMFAGHRSHRSHSSHRSHYSSRSYSSPPTTTTTLPRPTNVIDTTSAKMIQVALNLLGYKAGKVDGQLGGVTKEALLKFQKEENLTATGKVDGQTCLILARKVKATFPEDPNAKKVHDNLLRTYLKIGTSQ